MEKLTCKTCSTDFSMDDEEKDFYKRIDVPIPVDCPRCRQNNRIIFRNFKTLYKRNSDKSGKPIVSMYSNKAKFPVWAHDEWWDDDWDPRDFGRDIDFSRPVFEQLKELWDLVPHSAVFNLNSENCVYSNGVAGSRNCYLVFGCVDNEDCAYGHITWNSRECFDCLYVFKSELCYECTDVLGSYRVFHSQECEDCNDSVGLYDCKSCSNCIGCVGLRQKNYHVFNEDVGKEGYEKFLKENPLNDPKTIEMILNKQMELRKKLPQRHFFGSNNNNVSGNHIYNAKNIQHGFDIKSGENSRYVFTVRKAIESYDMSFTSDIEHGYYSITAIGARNSMFSHYFSGSDIYYSNYCFSSRDIFACTGLRGSEYCILNKQYSKEEYKELKAKLIEHMKKTGEWGKFFPVEMSPFAYNESIIQEYMPLTKEEALSKGYRWEDDIPRTTGTETKAHDELPKDPKQYSDDLLKEVLKCESCDTNYLLIKSELDFLKNNGLALPKDCFNCRHQRRMDSRNKRVLHDGNCSKCGKEFKTSYPEGQQKEFQIYCAECYKTEMV